MIQVRKGNRFIKVIFPYNPQLVERRKSIKGKRWHSEGKYYLPAASPLQTGSFSDTNGTPEKILKAFDGEQIHIDPALQVKTSTSVIKRYPGHIKGPKQSQEDPSLAKMGYEGFSDKKLSATPLDDLKREILSRKYSYRTIKGYIYYNRDLLNFRDKSPNDINDNDIKNYLVYLAKEKQSATSTLNQVIHPIRNLNKLKYAESGRHNHECALISNGVNAPKFYYGTMLKKNFVYEVKRPRKDKKLPVVLSLEEVAKILNSVDNLKH